MTTEFEIVKYIDGSRALLFYLKDIDAVFSDEPSDASEVERRYNLRKIKPEAEAFLNKHFKNHIVVLLWTGDKVVVRCRLFKFQRIGTAMKQAAIFKMFYG